MPTQYGRWKAIGAAFTAGQDSNSDVHGNTEHSWRLEGITGRQTLSVRAIEDALESPTHLAHHSWLAWASAKH